MLNKLKDLERNLEFIYLHKHINEYFQNFIFMCLESKSNRTKREGELCFALWLTLQIPGRVEARPGRIQELPLDLRGGWQGPKQLSLSWLPLRVHLQGAGLEADITRTLYSAAPYQEEVYVIGTEWVPMILPGMLLSPMWGVENI